MTYPTVRAATGRRGTRRIPTLGAAGPAGTMLAVAALALAALTGCAGFGGSEDPPAADGDRGVLTEQTTAGAPAPDGSPTAPDEPAASPAALPDACSLVSKQEAEKLARTPLDDAVPVGETCTYTGPASGPTAQVEVYVGDSAKNYLEAERALGHDIKPLAGIGDEAYAEDGSVFVSKSGVWVSIRLVRTDDPAVYRKPMEDLVRAVAGRL